MADVKALAEELVNLSVKDVQELAKVLKEEYGIEPAAAAVAVAAPVAGGRRGQVRNRLWYSPDERLPELSAGGGCPKSQTFLSENRESASGLV